jgi:hypothetical protein
MAVSRKTPVDRYYEAVGWPVSWSAIWVGALAALALALMIGLLGISIGAYPVNMAARLSAHELHLPGLIFSVCGAFFSFVAGGWAAGKILGAHRSEPAMLHGALAWLVAVPLLVLMASLGAAGLYGAWYAGLAGTPVWFAGAATVDPHAAQIARSAALGALSALLLGLVGAVIGAWMASGEPMTLTYHRTRAAFASGHAE